MDEQLLAIFSATADLNGKSAEKRSPGAPLGNSNAYKHGLRTAKLGPQMEYIHRKANLFRATAEAETLSLRGKLGIWEQSLLQSAAQWLICALKIERLLRLGDAELTSDQKVNYSERIAKACNERDRCLQRLGLDAADPKFAGSLYALPQLPDDEPEGQTNAPAEPPSQ
jgi:hypothetical protein